MGNFCCPKKNKNFNLHFNENENEQTNESDRLMQPLLQTQIGEYRSLNTIDPNLYSNIEDVRIKPSNFISQNKTSPSEVYYFISEIGEGSYGLIVKVKHKHTGEIRAMKIIDKKRLVKGVNFQLIINEIKILKSLDHPHIIKIYEFFSDDLFVYIVMEYSEMGDLFHFFKELNSQLNEQTICQIIKQITSAVAYLHSKNIIHGDIKLENILLSSVKTSNNFKLKSSPSKNLIKKDVDISKIGLFQTERIRERQGESKETKKRLSFSSNEILYIEIKIIDFGCSKYFKPNDYSKELIGTAYYVAPEVLLQKYNNKCDLWSIGVILYALVNGKPPFLGKSQKEIIEKIKNGKYSIDSVRFNRVSIELIDFLKQLLNYQFEKRPSAYQALKHCWFLLEKYDVHSENSTINEDEVIRIINHLYQYSKRPKSKLKQAILTIITHNIHETEEILRLKEAFSKFDIDFDGRISFEDLEITVKQHFPSLIEEDSLVISVILKVIDYDKNGFIEFEEFLKALINEKEVLTEENLVFSFNFFFKGEKSAYLTRKISIKEIEEVIFQGFHIKDVILKEIMSEIGKDVSGLISYEEFKEIVLK